MHNKTGLVEHTMQDGNDPAHENDQQRVLRADISGMHCANCVVAVERHLKALPQVERVECELSPREGDNRPQG